MKVYAYTDYRKFVIDQLSKIKAIPNQSIAKRLKSFGISNPSFLLRITKYDGKISKESAKKLALFLELDNSEQVFFCDLVQFNQSEDISEKRLLAKKLLRSKGLKTHAPMVADQYEYFSSWLNVVVYEFLALKGLSPRPDEIAKRLRGFAREEEVQSSLDLLKRLGLAVESRGSLRQSKKIITSQENEVMHTLFEEHYRAFFKFGSVSATEDPVDKRELASITFAAKESKIGVLKEMIRDFRDEIAQAVADEADGDQVYEVLLQLFPITK